MSKIPPPGQGKPMLKRSTTVTSKLPTGTRTVTNVNISELKSCASKGTQLPGQKQDCATCPSKINTLPRAGSSRLQAPGSHRGSGIQQPQQLAAPRQQPVAAAGAGAGRSGIRPPAPRASAAGPAVAASDSQSNLPPCCRKKRAAAAASGLRQPTVVQKPPSPEKTPPRGPLKPLPSTSRQHRADVAGEYYVPAEYGPKTVRGKGMTYSSPQALRGQLEGNIPQELKYFGSKPPPGGRGRETLQSRQAMQDITTGSFRVPAGGAPRTEESIIDAADVSFLEKTIDQDEAAKLFELVGPDVEQVEEQVYKELMERAASQQAGTVFSKGSKVSQVSRKVMDTPGGPQPIIQQTYLEQRVERDENAEKLVRNMSVTDFDEATGQGRQVTLSQQQLSPRYRTKPDEKEMISLRETMSVSQEYSASARDVVVSQTNALPDVDPREVAQMVAEEKEDVENTLRMVPPDLTLAPDKYGIKTRLQKLRLNSESVVLLEQSVVNPPSNAGEAEAETPPEAVANIMHTIEIGVTPQCAPDQVFNTLFEERPAGESKVVVSPVTPGVLQDVVVPTSISRDVHLEVMTQDVHTLTEKMRNLPKADQVPGVDIFSTLVNENKISPKDIERKDKSFKIQDESLPWGAEDIEQLVNLVGAEPAEVLEPADVSVLQTEGGLEDELKNGIEYFVDADPIQYMSRVQLRGSQPPCWFPGYIVALPEFPDLVKVARNPYEVFYSAWKATQPRIIPDDSIVVAP